MNIRYEDLPIQEKHPDWVEWFERNGLDYRQILTTRVFYDSSEKTISCDFICVDEDGIRLLSAKGGYETYRSTVEVDSAPPWEEVGK